MYRSKVQSTFIGSIGSKMTVLPLPPSFDFLRFLTSLLSLSPVTLTQSIVPAMRVLEERLIISPESSASGSPRLYSWISDCHGFWHNLFLAVPSLIFVVYLGFQARRSYSKLSQGRSLIMISYYVSLWVVTLLNMAWCLLQAWECNPEKVLTWNTLSLLTASGMLFLEVSLLAFLLQGNYASGLEALAKTFAISGIVVGIDIILKAIYIFVMGIPLFIDTDEPKHSVKWNLWVLHKLFLTAIYGGILFMYHSNWRERLPARPAFYKYIIIMLSLNGTALFACGLTGNGAGFGLWLNYVTIVCYHALYLPLLYVTFLADFFQEDSLHLENVYYSEMKDAGFFDADWE